MTTAVSTRVVESAKSSILNELAKLPEGYMQLSENEVVAAECYHCGQASYRDDYYKATIDTLCSMYPEDAATFREGYILPMHKDTTDMAVTNRWFTCPKCQLKAYGSRLKYVTKASVNKLLLEVSKASVLSLAVSPDKGKPEEADDWKGTSNVKLIK